MHAKGNLYRALCTGTGYDEWSNTPGAFPTDHHPEYDRTKEVLDKVMVKVEKK